MNLLDAAEVVTRGPGGWERGWDGESRACGDVSVYLSECDPAVTHDVVGQAAVDLDTVDDCGYRVIPFGVVATLTRSTRNAREDDARWLIEALRLSAEMPVARGLLVRQGMGNAMSDVWIGSPDVEGIVAPALTDANAVAAAVSEARERFFRKTLGIAPVLHVNPGSAIALKRAGVVELKPDTGEDTTAWGDPVVISQGYSNIPDLTASPVAFFTGPITITLSEIKEEDVIRATRQNKLVHQVTMLAAIDTAPCAMVRIGPAPVPTP